jgi:methylated-DNA-[protein]-cysteine S-methyltransferase
LLDCYPYQTALGIIAVYADGQSIVRLSFGPIGENLLITATPLIQEAYRQLTQYLNGTRRSFTLPLDPHGTIFQQSVWRALQTIPYGQTKTYGQIAADIDNPQAARAVGMANHKNPLPIFIPCHRVIGADGSLTGYGGGLSIKQVLLELERHNMYTSPKKRIIDQKDF